MITDMAPGETMADRLAAVLTARIRAGVFRPGDRLPSVRGLARAEGVNPQTAVRALQCLEDAGLAEPRPRSGWFVRSVRAGVTPQPGAGTPQPVALPELARQILTQRFQPGLIAMGAAQPGPDLLPITTLSRLHASALRQGGADLLGRYSDPAGEAGLRRAVARVLEDRGLHCGPDDIIITNGCMEALDLALSVLAAPGAVVAVETPAYYGVLLALAGHGLRVVELAADSQTGVSPAAVRAALAAGDGAGGPLAACLLSPLVHNPLGGSVPVAARQEIRQDLLAAGVPLIEDDCFGFLHGPLSDPRPMLAFSGAGDGGLLCGSVSKTVGPGLRIGWIVPGRWHEAVLQASFRRHLSHPAPAQAVVARFLDSGGHARLARRATAEYRRRQEVLVAELRRQMPQQTVIAEPRAGMSLWLTLPDGLEAMAVMTAARHHGLSVVPGPLFSPVGGYASSLRLSVGSVGPEDLPDAVRRLAAAVADFR